MSVITSSSSSHCSCTKQLDVSHLSFDGARETIDRRIQELYESIRRLQEQRNKLTSISRLPSELLILIFKLVNNPRADSDERYNGSYSNGGVLSTLRWKQFSSITQVCRHWRGITLAHSDFWSYIIFQTPAIAEGMLQRSNKSPLYIHMSNNIFVRRQKQSLQSKFMDMSRLAELHLDLETDDLQSLLSAATGNTANFLRSIYILGRSRSFSPGSYSIPSIIFPSTPLPHLRHLNFIDCNLDWSALHFGKQSFNNLISLKLMNVSPPPKKLFYSFLSHTPELETLAIDGSVLPSSTDSVSQGVIQNVRLPNLCSCTLQNIALVDCVDFQDLVIYPATKARLKFELFKEPRIQHSSNVSVDNTSLINRLLISCGLSKDSSPKRAHQNLLLRDATWGGHGGSNGPIGITLWNGPFTHATDHLLHLSLFNNSQVEITFLRHIELSTLSIPGVERLAIRDVVSRYSRKDWFTFFNNHYRISQMYIESSDLLPITTVLSTPARTSIGHRLCLPSLDTVTLSSHCEHFTRAEGAHEIESLVDCVIARCNYYVPLQRLNLRQCYLLDDNDVALLEDTVVHVDWDGECLGSDNEDEDGMDEDNQYNGLYYDSESHWPSDFGDSFDEEEGMHSD